MDKLEKKDPMNDVDNPFKVLNKFSLFCEKIVRDDSC